MKHPDDGAERVAIVGTGEMGSAIGRRLREYGAQVRTSLVGRSAASTQRVERAGLEVRNDDGELIEDVGFLLSIVPPAQALSVAQRFHDPLRRAKSKPIYVECNAVSPATVRQIADLLEDTECGFIDASIIGGPPLARRDATTGRTSIYASGSDASLLKRLTNYGLDVELLDDRVGSASAFKMCYGGLTKGLTALGSVMIRAAARHNLASALLAELAQSQAEMLKLLSRRVPGMLAKAYRWEGEMEEIASFLHDDEAGAKIFTGAARLYSRLAEEVRQDPEFKSRELSDLLRFFDNVR
jgi:3-hydroxyisobutyrate dehydrogenase-like beta-hydroxyacid dehydrogenase